MTATVLQVRRCADLYIATGTPVAASLVISICDQLDDAKESINALTLALEVERDAANLYAKQVAHWIGKHDALLEQQLKTVHPIDTSPEHVQKSEGIERIGCVQHDCEECKARGEQPKQEPLTLEQIVSIVESVEDSPGMSHIRVLQLLTKAIEKHHGIGDKT